jgi:peptide-methionine (S)-S-oxide reductase
MPGQTGLKAAAVALLALGAGAAIYGGKRTMSEAKSETKPQGAAQAKPAPAGLETATFGAGCFWCTEAVFQQLKGVHSVVSGYSGGTTKNPTYEEVCSGATGHAEVTQVKFDPQVVSYAELLEVFWKTHDPTTLNRQGNDFGTQYRSAIFYHDEEQKRLAEHYKKELDEAGAFSAPIVTEITPFEEFYAAEDYHQKYFDANPRQPYCAAIIRPKVDKVRKVFADKLK